MYGLNKLAWAFGNPAVVGLLVLTSCWLLAKRKVFRVAGWVVLGGLWLWCTPVMTRIVGTSLERPYVVYDANGLPRMREAADYPVCDAIVDLGGGTGIHTNFYNGVQMNSSADRVYFSAMLWKAGKAPIVIPSGMGCVKSDGQFLRDLGVPADAIVADNAARNTEENAKFVGSLLMKREAENLKCQVEAMNFHHSSTSTTNFNSRILLVTSAWHMKRSVLMFQKYAPSVEVVPAPCDFECANWLVAGIDWSQLLPSFECAGLNSVYLHEWIGYWWYKLFRVENRSDLFSTFRIRPAFLRSL